MLRFKSILAVIATAFARPCVAAPAAIGEPAPLAYKAEIAGPSSTYRTLETASSITHRAIKLPLSAVRQMRDAARRPADRLVLTASLGWMGDASVLPELLRGALSAEDGAIRLTCLRAVEVMIEGFGPRRGWPIEINSLLPKMSTDAKALVRSTCVAALRDTFTMGVGNDCLTPPNSPLRWPDHDPIYGQYGHAVREPARHILTMLGCTIKRGGWKVYSPGGKLLSTLHDRSADLTFGPAEAENQLRSYALDTANYVPYIQPTAEASAPQAAEALTALREACGKSTLQEPIIVDRRFVLTTMISHLPGGAEAAARQAADPTLNPTAREWLSAAALKLDGPHLARLMLATAARATTPDVRAGGLFAVRSVLLFYHADGARRPGYFITGNFGWPPVLLTGPNPGGVAAADIARVCLPLLHDASHTWASVGYNEWEPVFSLRDEAAAILRIIGYRFEPLPLRVTPVTERSVARAR